MVQIQFLEKARFAEIAPALFSILYRNTQLVAPSPEPPEEEFPHWYAAVEEGLRRNARQIVLAESQCGEILGFCQYYTNSEVFMIEEIQILPEYQNKPAFLGKLAGFVLSHVPGSPKYAEAFARKEDHRSLSLQKKLGFQVIGQARQGSLYHLRGDYLKFRSKFCR